MSWHSIISYKSLKIKINKNFDNHSLKRHFRQNDISRTASGLCVWKKTDQKLIKKKEFQK
jgi:hypothetical protein